MITYERLWLYMQKNNVSQYKLVVSGISHSTLTRLKHNQSVSIDTIDKLCSILKCQPENIMEYKENDC